MTTETRQPHPDLEAAFKELCETPSDINEHLPVLRQLAEQCEHVTEMGMRTGVSTIAFLAAQPKTLISWDIDPNAILHPSNILRSRLSGRTSFQPRVGDTLKISPIETTDMLFIDTLHTARQLRDELERHVDPMRMPVKKFLVFHDTVTFGMKGEDGTEPGLRAAIRWFQRCHAFPQWELLHDYQNNNGLVVLRAAKPLEVSP